MFINYHKRDEGRVFSFDNFESPFYRELAKPKEDTLYGYYPVIPYMGDHEYVSDHLLHTMYKVAEVTPMYQGVLSSRKMFVFSGGYHLYEKNDNFLYNNSKDIIDGETLRARLSELTNTSLMDILLDCFVSLEVDGNCGVLFRYSTKGKMELEYVNTRQFRYHLNGKDVVIAPSFIEHFEQEDIHVVPLYPRFADNKGVLETFIHIKDKSTGRKLYGLSSAASSLMSQYLINQITSYLSAEVDNRFTGQVLFDIETELGGDGEIPEGGMEFLNMLRKVYKAKGKKESIMAHFRETGTGPIQTTQFKSETNEGFYDTTKRITNDDIIFAFAWDKRLVGLSRENGLGGNDLETIFAISSKKVSYLQGLLNKMVNQVFRSLYLVGEMEFKDVEFGLKNLYSSMINEEGIFDLTKL